MRVLHLVDRLDTIGGVPTYLAGLLPALASEGIESVVATADDSRAEFAGARCVHVPAVGSTAPRLTAAERSALRSALGNEAPDVVYSHTARSPDVVAVACEQAPTLVYVHDYFTVCPGSARYLHNRVAFCEEGPGARCFWRAYTERCTNRRPDRLVNEYRRVKAWERTWQLVARALVAAPFAADVMAASGVPRDRIVVVPYFVRVGEPLRGEAATDVLYVGRLTASKGVHVLLQALSALPGTTAVIAGDGPERPALERLAGRLGLSERATFLGWVGDEERDRLLAQSRVFALPSLWDEAFGIAGLEALAAGVPVIASAVGGIPFWLEDDEGGRLVPRGDSRALAEALRAVLADRALYDRLAETAPRAVRRFGLERHLERLVPELRRAAAP